MRSMPTNHDEYINSRDIIKRISELEDSISDNPNSDDAMELAALMQLQEQCDVSEWYSGTTLIRDDAFADYAQNLAESIGAVNLNADWPLNCIDWEMAAEELQSDYSAVEFDGVTYWVHL